MNWIPFNAKTQNTYPKSRGRYLICRKDGKIHFEKWNGTGWAYNHKVIKYYAEVIPPKEFQ